MTDRPYVVFSESYREGLARWCGEGADFLERLSCQELRSCEREGRASCPIFYESMGTAFVAEEEGTLWTVRHLSDSWYERLREWRREIRDETELHRGALEREPGLLLFDFEGRRVYDTRSARDRVELRFLGNVLLMEPEHVYPGKSTDFAVLRLGRAIPGARPLRIRETAPRVGERVFILGYPTATQGRAQDHQSRDSDGRSPLVSRGRVISALTFIRAALGPDGAELLARAFDPRFLYQDADATQGQSGAPVVDEEGRVVSIFASHSSHRNKTSSEAYHPAGGFGLRISWARRLLNTYSK